MKKNINNERLILASGIGTRLYSTTGIKDRLLKIFSRGRRRKIMKKDKNKSYYIKEFKDREKISALLF